MYCVLGLVPVTGEKQPVRGYYTIDAFNRDQAGTHRPISVVRLSETPVKHLKTGVFVSGAAPGTYEHLKARCGSVSEPILTVPLSIYNSKKGCPIPFAELLFQNEQ